MSKISTNKKPRPKNSPLTDLDKYAIHGMLAAGLSEDNMRALLNLNDESTVLHKYLSTVNDLREYNNRLVKGVVARLLENGVNEHIGSFVAREIVNRVPRKTGLALDIEVDELFKICLKEIKSSDLMKVNTNAGKSITAMNGSIGVKDSNQPPERLISRITDNPDVFKF